MGDGRKDWSTSQGSESQRAEKRKSGVGEKGNPMGKGMRKEEGPYRSQSKAKGSFWRQVKLRKRKGNTFSVRLNSDSGAKFWKKGKVMGGVRETHWDQEKRNLLTRHTNDGTSKGFSDEKRRSSVTTTMGQKPQYRPVLIPPFLTTAEAKVRGERVHRSSGPKLLRRGKLEGREKGAGRRDSRFSGRGGQGGQISYGSAAEPWLAKRGKTFEDTSIRLSREPPRRGGLQGLAVGRGCGQPRP